MTGVPAPMVAGAPPSTEQPRPPRLWFIDNLRVALTCLVVLHHVVTAYSGTGLWYYTEKPASAAVGLGLTVFLMVNQAWFMGAFFFLSGCFTPGSYGRKGPRAFLRDRLIRVGVPLVVFYLVLEPVLLLALGAYQGDPALHWYLSAVGAGPLWFLLMLLVLDVSYALVRWVARRGPTRPGGGLARTAAPGPWMIGGLVLMLALVTYLWRIVVPIGLWIPVVDLPTGAYLPQYVGFFTLGMVAYRRGWCTAVPARAGLFGLGLAVGATLLFLPAALASGGQITGVGTLSSLCYALWDSSVAVGICLALLALFRSRVDGTGPLRRHLAQHSFTVYVTHAFVVTAVCYGLGYVALPTLAKVAIAGVVTIPASFALATAIRRLPGVRRVL